MNKRFEKAAKQIETKSGYVIKSVTNLELYYVAIGYRFGGTEYGSYLWCVEVYDRDTNLVWQSGEMYQQDGTFRAEDIYPIKEARVLASEVCTKIVEENHEEIVRLERLADFEHLWETGQLSQDEVELFQKEGLLPLEMS